MVAKNMPMRQPVSMPSPRPGGQSTVLPRSELVLGLVFFFLVLVVDEVLFAFVEFLDSLRSQRPSSGFSSPSSKSPSISSTTSSISGGSSSPSSAEYSSISSKSGSSISARARLPRPLDAPRERLCAPALCL